MSQKTVFHVRLLAAVQLFAVAACGQDPAVAHFADAFPAQADFDRPVFLAAHANDPEHYWVVEQYGAIRRIPREGERGERATVADFSSICLHPRNGGHNEEGLLGFAFAPAWEPAGGHVFVYYSHDLGGDGRDKRRESVVARYATRVADGGAIALDLDSALVVMRVAQPWGNHNGGTLVFGPDGMLYVALGDGGAADDRGGNGQNLGTLLASVLRIDVSEATADSPYRVPDDNPFVGVDGARPEIWAYGLRNPWRISFDRETGELWCGDVGQNLWEEVGRVVRGGNHGWPLMEGLHAFPPDAERPAELRAKLVMPLTEYPRSEGISVTGGHVYRGRAIPALVGRFVYGDFATRKVWAAKAGTDGSADVLELGRAPGLIASFAEEPDGELLVLGFDGRIQRIVP
ncbi:MAG: PQQ-dependent sugar dehydrogenase [Planctomycetes bacterium]|nr:PQQ-dependent sugar dehydrogenase [Planctomycetota bacterium]